MAKKKEPASFGKVSLIVALIILGICVLYFGIHYGIEEIEYQQELSRCNTLHTYCYDDCEAKLLSIINFVEAGCKRSCDSELRECKVRATKNR